MKKTPDSKVVMISGGLGDIALATALVFGREGASVALSDIHVVTDDDARLEILRSENIDFSYQQVNTSESAAVVNWINKVNADWGRIDTVIVNAAVITQKSIASITADEWRSDIDVNLNGAFYVSQQASIYFSANKIRGNIVFLGSWAAHAVHPHIPAYSVSKAGIRMLCQCMALEFASIGIRVNEIAPGYVNAGLSREVWNQHPALAEEARLKVPVKKLIEAGEVAEQILWLCREENRHITGSCILMDGGLSLLRP